jgi:hypothetical protein
MPGLLWLPKMMRISIPVMLATESKVSWRVETFLEDEGVEMESLKTNEKDEWLQEAIIANYVRFWEW